LRPDDFTQPVLASLRQDILLMIDDHRMDCSSVQSVLADVIGHCLGATQDKTELETSIEEICKLIRRNAMEIFTERSSLLIIEPEGTWTPKRSSKNAGADTAPR
jgi:hypothetical protein